MSFVNRRTFLQQSLGAAAVIAAPCTLRAAAGAPTAFLPQPCAPTAWQKHGVVIEPTEDWEGGTIENFTSPPEPLAGDRWRLWYSPCGKKYSIAYAEGIPGGSLKKVPAQCMPGEPGDGPFSVGHLPDKWNPVQVVHIHLRNDKPRIYFWADGPGIARYLAADSDDGRRYTGVNSAHNGKHSYGPPRDVVMYATADSIWA